MLNSYCAEFTSLGRRTLCISLQCLLTYCFM